jgi:signal transduction histidine kinase
VQVGEELRSELALVKEELQKLEQLNADLRKELFLEKENSARQLAGAEADAEDVIRELRRSVGDLKGQLKQQVGLGCGRALEHGEN